MNSVRFLIEFLKGQKTMNPAWLNHRILITPNELFDNGGEGTVLAVEGNALALRLLVPVRLPSGKECHNLVASIRHANRIVDEIMAGHPVLCALTLVPVDKFDPARPCDVSWWRGNGAAIGNIRAEAPFLEEPNL
jgi:hypothetical protein